MASGEDRAAQPLGSGILDDCSSNVVHPPGLWDKGDVGWHVLRPDIAGGEHDPQIRPQTLGGLGELVPLMPGMRTSVNRTSISG